MLANDLRNVDAHFKFGENWREYSRTIDSRALQNARDGLLKLVSAEQWVGKTVVDIGSGSGLHAAAMLDLGAAHVTAFDIDPDSVATSRAVLAQHGGSWVAEERSVFDTDGLQCFDIVYSWGVLHHTGDMWAAVEHASRLVAPGGIFVIALYQRTPACVLWGWEKEAYTKAGPIVRKAIRTIFTSAFFAGLLATRRNPFRYVRNYRTNRGMNYWHDVHDWLGGYPYESASPTEIVSRVEALGLKAIRQFPLRERVGLFGTGCAEFVFQRPE